MIANVLPILVLGPIPTLLCSLVIYGTSISKIQNIPRIRKMVIALGYANFMPVLSAILMIWKTQPFKCSGQSIVLLLAFCWLIVQVLIGLILLAASFGSCQPMGSVKAALLNLASIPVAQRRGGTENV